MGAIAACGLAAMPVAAQSNVFTDGFLMTRAGFGYADMSEFANYNNGFGTARSAALGGAFTSLGADLSSMSINPAGLGMYRSSEIGFTPAVTVGRGNGSSNGMSFDGGSKTRFAPGNAGVALNLFQGSRGLTSFTFGLSYNKVADFTYGGRVGMPADKTSISEVFVRQLSGETLGSDYFGDYSETMWGSILGFDNKLVSLAPGHTDQYDISSIDANTIKSHDAYFKSRGRVGEFNFSGGFNFKNRIYMGLSLTAQEIYMRQSVDYTEQYTGAGVPNPLTDMRYMQAVRVTGDAFNFKFGLAANIVAGLRVGVAVHTPSYIKFRKQYSAYMSTKFQDGSTYRGEAYIDDDPQYEYRTPARLMGGISYTFKDFGLITFDYERAWYNGMRIDAGGGFEAAEIEADYKRLVKEVYKPRDIYRMGLEFKPLPLLALRGGFAYYGSFLKDSDMVHEAPIAHKGFNASAGIGTRFGKMSLDLTYVYMEQETAKLDMYRHANTGSNGQIINEVKGGAPASIKYEKHNIMMSLGVRF